MNHVTRILDIRPYETLLTRSPLMPAPGLESLDSPAAGVESNSNPELLPVTTHSPLIYAPGEIHGPRPDWYHFVWGSIPGYQQGYILHPAYPVGPLTHDHVSCLSPIIKFVETVEPNPSSCTIVNLCSRKEMNSSSWHIAIVFGLQLKESLEHGGRAPRFNHAFVSINRPLTREYLLSALSTFRGHLLGMGNVGLPRVDEFYQKLQNAQDLESRQQVVREYLASFPIIARLPGSEPPRGLELGALPTSDATVYFDAASESNTDRVDAGLAKLAITLLAAQVHFSWVGTGEIGGEHTDGLALRVRSAPYVGLATDALVLDRLVACNPERLLRYLAQGRMKPRNSADSVSVLRTGRLRSARDSLRSNRLLSEPAAPPPLAARETLIGASVESLATALHPITALPQPPPLPPFSEPERQPHQHVVSRRLTLALTFLLAASLLSNLCLFLFYLSGRISHQVCFRTGSELTCLQHGEVPSRLSPTPSSDTPGSGLEAPTLAQPTPPSEPCTAPSREPLNRPVKLLTRTTTIGTSLASGRKHAGPATAPISASADGQRTAVKVPPPEPWQGAAHIPMP